MWLSNLKNSFSDVGNKARPVIAIDTACCQEHAEVSGGTDLKAVPVNCQHTDTHKVHMETCWG